MSGVNKVILIGHLGADPELHRTADGRQLASFSLATSENWKDKATGEKRERTEWHRVVVYQDGLTKIASEYLKKGSKVYIEGKNQTRKWTAKDGGDRYTTEVVLSGFGCQIVLCDRASSGRAPAPTGESAGDVRAPAAAPAIDDEIPF